MPLPNRTLDFKKPALTPNKHSTLTLKFRGFSRWCVGMSPPVFLRRHKIRVGAVKPKTFVPMLKHFRAIEGEQIMIEITACLGQAARLGVDPC
jgi:hypothetical protein